MTDFDPKNKTILITGGSRSGKSTFAERLGESIEGKRAFLATCPEVDEEMAARIERHREARAGKGWETVEAPVKLDLALKELEAFDVVLVDCMTLWINNILYEGTSSGDVPDEDQIVVLAQAVMDASMKIPTSLFVTNEVGMGLVPPDPMSRLYRDLVGRCNQELAKRADHVVLMTAGIPQFIK